MFHSKEVLCTKAVFLFSHLHLFSAGCHTGKYPVGIKGLSMLPSVQKVGPCYPWTAALALLESLRIHWKSWPSNSRSVLLWLCSSVLLATVISWCHGSIALCVAGLQFLSLDFPLGSNIFKWFYLFILGVHTWWRSEASLQESVPSILWVLGIEHGALGLAGTFTSLVLYISLKGSLKMESFCILEAVSALPMHL